LRSATTTSSVSVCLRNHNEVRSHLLEPFQCISWYVVLLGFFREFFNKCREDLFKVRAGCLRCHACVLLVRWKRSEQDGCLARRGGGLLFVDRLELLAAVSESRSAGWHGLPFTLGLKRQDAGTTAGLDRARADAHKSLLHVMLPALTVLGR